MEVKASISYVRISPQKLRLLTRGLRDLGPQEAIRKLQFYSQKGKIFLEKLIKQGEANAVNNFKLSRENLYIKQIEVNEGPSLKRMDKSHGARFDRGLLKRRSSRLSLVLAEKEEKQPEKPKEKMEVIKKEEGAKPPSLKLRRSSGAKN